MFANYILGQSESEEDSSEDEKKRKKNKKSTKKKKRKTHHKSKKRLAIYSHIVVSTDWYCCINWLFKNLMYKVKCTVHKLNLLVLESCHVFYNIRNEKLLMEVLFIYYINLNPLTPLPAVTGCDEYWPLFHFWHHQLWANLASYVLNFCQSERSFQWYLDQSDWVNAAWNNEKMS